MPRTDVLRTLRALAESSGKGPDRVPAKALDSPMAQAMERVIKETLGADADRLAAPAHALPLLP